MADLSHLAVIFDLDGTLIDSMPDIHATANRVFAAMGFAALSLPEVQAHVGKGLPNLVARLLEHHGQTAAGPLLTATIARFETEYATAHSLTTPYPGVPQALTTLAAAGAALGLCTNKPLTPAKAILQTLGLAPRFAALLGGDSLATRKPDPEHLLATARLMGRREVIFVGDSEVDAETAKSANLPFLLFTEGYRKTPVHEIAHTAAFSDWSSLPRLIENLA